MKAAPKRRVDRRRSCRRTAAAFAALLVLMLVSSACHAEEKASDVPTFAEALGELRKEKTTAESYLILLHTLKSGDMHTWAQGIRDYANARASFAGLIQQLKTALSQDKEPPASSEKFQRALREAVAQRAVFTDRVDEIVDAMGEDGKRGPVVAATALAAALPALSKAARSIWDEYWRIGEEQRRDLMDDLESLRWKPFNQLVDLSG